MKITSKVYTQNYIMLQLTTNIDDTYIQNTFNKKSML